MLGNISEIPAPDERRQATKPLVTTVKTDEDATVPAAAIDALCKRGEEIFDYLVAELAEMELSESTERTATRLLTEWLTAEQHEFRMVAATALARPAPAVLDGVVLRGDDDTGLDGIESNPASARPANAVLRRAARRVRARRRSSAVVVLNSRLKRDSVAGYASTLEMRSESSCPVNSMNESLGLCVRTSASSASPVVDTILWSLTTRSVS